MTPHLLDGDFTGPLAVGNDVYGKAKAGLLLGGVGNLVTDSEAVLLVAGLGNLTERSHSGGANMAYESSVAQVAGLASHAWRSTGLQAAGIMSFAEVESTGLQAGGLLSISGNHTGVQAGLVDVDDRSYGILGGVRAKRFNLGLYVEPKEEASRTEAPSEPAGPTLRLPVEPGEGPIDARQ